MRAEDENLLEQMFDNKRQYQIPVYQRNYDWRKDHCLELFNDVVEAYRNSKSHFLGSIVQVQQEEEGGIKHFIIIDGQQRMTSIYLLLKALYDNCNSDDSVKEELEGLLFNNSSSREFSKEDKNKLKLKPIKSDNEQFLLLMTNKIDKMDKGSNIFINYDYFCTLIKKSSEEEITVKNILKGLKYLRIVMISLKEPDDDPQVIFERINSTGEDLKLADLIRNYLMMTDTDMNELFEDYWLPIEELIGKDKINDYFATYLLYKLPDSNDKNGYQQFKKYADKNGISHREILSELKKLSKYYKAFISENDSYSKEVNNILKGYRILKQSTIYPLFFSIFDDFEDQIITEEQLIEVLTFFLNYTLRRAITGVPTNSLRGLYKGLYKRMFATPELKDNYINSVYSFMANIPSTKDVVPNNTIFKDKLKTENIYKNNVLCKFILTILENGLSSLKEQVMIDDQITIEHIMPQNKDNEDWKNEIGEDFDYVYDKYLHTLGNLTLTGYNSELSDKSFADKKVLIAKSKFTKLNSDVVDKNTWNESSIQKRAERLSSILLEEFKLPEIFEKTIIKPESTRHTVDDGYDLTKKKVTSFILLGENRDVANITDMLLQVSELLNTLNPELMNSLASSNYVPKDATSTLLSFDKNILRTPKEIGNTGIYIETNKSSNDIIRTIKKLLEEFDLGYDDFIFYVE